MSSGFDCTDKICQYHLRGRCSWGITCQNVHCDLPYQWRWRESWSNRWTAFGENENERIEQAFCDPATEKYIASNGMTIYFKSMSDSDYEGRCFKIERLSTPSSVNHGNQTWRTKWLWYWKNPEGRWRKYGHSDKYEGNAAKIKSNELEAAFVADPTGGANFRTTGKCSYGYIVSFRSMTQRNTEYDTIRKMRRRPKFINKLDFELNHLRYVHNSGSGMSKTIMAPENWMIPVWKELSDHILIVPLNKSDSEYKEIENVFLKTLWKVRIKSIERIENGDLWENYMMKRSKMLKQKKDIGETRVFHGTKNNNISAICKQGFDFRLNGQATGTIYGKGCYFATNSSYSDSYAERGKDKSMFVAKILPGEYVCGEHNYSRPPPKDKSDRASDLYDSCVDDDQNPTIFVIFDNNQMYPEYMIRYKRK
ncbi:protein mono-ADP-ribosyltransferase PARP12-like [Ruditapes philippinarum]|uniref:protein mono-ADP-ribosyltransferase PARP12-like n=1 Tax=Ruditapes philippinarum TaxID=129788 RepID=UPI00295BE162|nr:protein mono-ADP-ribosyltransferase PARP12-like [Ruditapes philippinarum]